MPVLVVVSALVELGGGHEGEEGNCAKESGPQESGLAVCETMLTTSRCSQNYQSIHIPVCAMVRVQAVTYFLARSQSYPLLFYSLYLQIAETL